MAQRKAESLTRNGRLGIVHNSLKKWAKKWGLPCCTWNEFLSWAVSETNYPELYKDWEANGFANNLAPVFMRGVKKNGFITENLKPDIKGNYSWWNDDFKIFQEIEEKLDKQQKERNARDKAWRKKVREDWKTKRKGK